MSVALVLSSAEANSDPLGQPKSHQAHHIYSGGFANDFASSSIDLNQDGQPDNQQQQQAQFYNSAGASFYAFPNYP